MSNLTTAEQAASIRPFKAMGEWTSQEMVRAIAELRVSQPRLADYLSHPEIIIGLANGRFSPNELRRRLAQMADADDADGEFDGE